MITIKAVNTFLELNQSNPDMRVQLRSSFYGKITSMVVDLMVPNIPNNLIALNQVDKLNRINRNRQTIPITFYNNNSVLFEGTAITADINDKQIELSVTFILDEVAYALEKKKLNEVIYEEFDFSIEIFEDTILLNWPDTPVNFPSVYNPSFYGDKNPQFDGVINNCEETLLDKSYNANTVVPFVYLPEIVKRLFAHAGYSVSGEIFSDEFFKRALLYNNFALDKLLPFHFYAEKNPLGGVDPVDFIILWDRNIIDTLNNYNSTTGKYAIDSVVLYNIKATIKYSMGYEYLSGASTAHSKLIYENSVGGTVTIAEFEHEIDYGTIQTFEDVYDENATPLAPGGFVYMKCWIIDRGDWVHPTFIETTFIEITTPPLSSINVYQDSFNLKNHVPDMNCLDLLNKVFHDFAVYPIADRATKSVRLVSFEKYIKQLPERHYNEHVIATTLRKQESDYEGLTFDFNFEGPDNLINDNFNIPAEVEGEIATYPELGMQTPNLVYKFLPLNAFMERIFNEDTGAFAWQVICDNQVEKVYDEGTEPIPLSFAPMLMRYVANSGDIRRLLPAIDAPGTSDAFNIHNDFPLRIMFYMQYGGTYPEEYYYGLAMTTSRKLYVEEIDPLLSRDWTAENVAAMYWPLQIAWRKRRLPLRCSLLLNSDELAKIDLSKIAYLLNTTASIEQMHMKLLENGAVCEIEGFTT